MLQEKAMVSGTSDRPGASDGQGPLLTEPVRSAISEAGIALRDLYGPMLRDLRLYGSFARGDATDGSDVDLIVVLDGPVDPGAEIARTGALVSEISLRHSVVLACAFVTWERYRKGDGPFLRSVTRESVEV